MTAISTATRAALQQAAAMVERDAAQSDLVALLDPRRDQTLHTLAGTITRMIQTHQTGVENEGSRDAILEGLHSVGYEPVSRLGIVKISDQGFTVRSAGRFLSGCPAAY